MRRVLYLWVPHLQTTLERQWDPSLGGRPLLVIDASVARRPAVAGRRPSRKTGGQRRTAPRQGIILDASPEAEAQGATAGMPARHAERRCPDAVRLHGERARYEPVAVAIGDCLAEQTPWVERRDGTPDEFFADLGAGDPEEGLAIAQHVSERLARELGLEARMALATGRFAARALGRHPSTPLDPSVETHCLHIPEGEERALLRPLPIDALWEARPEVRRRMQLLGLRTLGQLAAMPQRLLLEQFGPAGRWYRLLARGVDPRRVRAWNPAPSIAAACALSTPEPDRALLEACLLRLAARIAARLVREGYYGRTVTLTLTLEDGRRLFAVRPLKEPTNLARTLARAGSALLAGWATRCAPAPAKLSLCVTDLESHGALQLSIFGDVDRGPALRAAIARIQERFGETAILCASERQ
jgi:DNA polymerase IV